MNGTVGRLERVPLREVWKHEAYDFTQWLQQNVGVLNEAIDLNLVNIEREQAAGAFSIDLVAEDESGGKVIIENQLEKSNHDHLGKLITYLSALNARAAIWIVADPRPEHVAAVSWLNDSSSADFYLVKVEAVRIGESQPAPLLTVIVQPSEEKVGISEVNKSFAERHHLRQAWWKLLLARPDTKRHAHVAPGNSPYLGTRWGAPDISLSYSVTQTESGVELYIGRRNPQENLSIFDRLFAKRGDIDVAFGARLDWDRMEGKKGCRIKHPIEGGYRDPEDQWETIQTQVVAAMRRLEEAFRPYTADMKIADGDEPE